MYDVYLYLTDTMADWETGYVMAELNSHRFFRKDAPDVTVRTAGITRDAVKTMGGLTVIPDITVEEIIVSTDSVLLLPGGNTWSEDKHFPVIAKAKEILEKGGVVAAICGATAALASAGILDDRKHTSNGSGFLELFCPSYRGAQHYVDEPAVSDDHLITAAGTAPLEWAYLIMKKLKVFSDETLPFWYEYFTSGSTEAFYELMNSLKLQT